MKKIHAVFLAAVFIFVALTGLLPNEVSAQTGYHLDITVKDYQEPYILLGYYLANRSFIQDTVRTDEPGKYIASGSEPLTPGMYLIILPPDNRFADFVIDENDQHMEISLGYAEPGKSLRISGSPNNELFLDYTRFIASKREQVNGYQEILDQTEDESRKEEIKAKIKEISDKVLIRQQAHVESASDMLASRIIRSTVDIVVPDPEEEMDEQEEQLWRYNYYKSRFFDHFDISDPDMLRTPMMFNKLNTYLDRLTPKVPDSINVALDFLLNKMEKDAPESFKFFLIHYLNQYARSNVVGMDAVYVHLVKNYYETNRAPWTDPDQLKRMVDNANALKPLLIGKTAPDLEMEDANGKKWRLHALDAEITILYFWDPECGHCKKSAPHLRAFYEEFKDRDVKIFSVCNKLTNHVPECWKAVDEFQFGNFINVADAYHRSRYRTLYDLKTTPQIYVLGRDKTILSKRISAEQLKEVVDLLLKAGV